MEGGCVAAVVHPHTLTGRGDLQAELQQRAQHAGQSQLLWLETAADDAGTGLARQAPQQGASLVLACCLPAPATCSPATWASHAGWTPPSRWPSPAGAARSTWAAWGRAR